MTEIKKRYRPPVSLTPRSKRHLEAEGWLVEKVEHWNPAVKQRIDLFGIGDLLAIRPNATRLIQVTDTKHQANRIDKIANHPNTPAIREAGWEIHVHGWLKNIKGRWVLTVTDVS